MHDPRPTFPGLDDEVPGALADLDTAAVAALHRQGRLEESVAALAQLEARCRDLEIELAETSHRPISRAQLGATLALLRRSAEQVRLGALRVGHHALLEVHLIRLLQEQTQAGALGELRQLRAGAQADYVAAWRLSQRVRRDALLWVALGVALGGWATVLVGGVIVAVMRG